VKVRWPLPIVLAAIAVTTWRITGGSGGEADWTRARRGDLVVEVEVTGELEAVQSAVLRPPQLPDTYNLKITMMAPEGSMVQAGDSVLAFDATDLGQQLDSALTEVDSAAKKVDKKRIDIELQNEACRLRLAEAEADLRRAKLKAARPPELIASIEFQKAALDLELAERELQSLEIEIEATRRAARAELDGLVADLEAAEVRVSSLRAGILKTTLAAPCNGVVVYSTGRYNDKKQVGDTAWYRDEVMEISDLRRMRAVGQVEEASAGKLESGQPVRFRLDAHPDTEYLGTVTHVATMLRRKHRRSPLKVMDVEIEMEGTDPRRMRPGMRFRGGIETRRIENVLTVPVDSIDTTGAGPVVYRRTLLRGTRPVPVQVGERGGAAVEILGGIDERDTILSRARVDQGADAG